MPWRSLLDGSARRWISAAKVASVSAAEGQLLVAAPAERVGEIAAAAGIVLHELRPQGASLEEVFLELTGGENR